MFFRTSPVWSAREEEVKSNKAYFGDDKQRWTCTPGKKKKKKGTHTELHSSLELSDLTVLSVFILLSDLCIPRHLLSCFFHFPSATSDCSMRDEPNSSNKSLKQGRMKTGKRLFNGFLCHPSNWMGPFRGKKKKKRGGKKSPKKGMPLEIHLLNKVLSSATYNTGLHISLPSDRKVGLGTGRD